MGHLEDAFKTPAEDIIYVLNVQLTKMNHRDTMKAFTTMNACSGVTTCIDGAASGRRRCDGVCTPPHL